MTISPIGDGVVEDVAEPAAQRASVERLGARERVLLADGEQQLDADRRALDRGARARARAGPRRRPCCRRRGSSSSALSQPPSTQTGSTAPVVRDGVEVRAEQDAVRSARGRDAREQVAALGAGLRGRRRPPRPPGRARAAPRRRGRRTARSCPNGLAIAQSSANESFSRAALGLGRPAARLATVGARGGRAGVARPRGRPPSAPLARAASAARDEVAEQRRRALGARLELGVELGGDEERVLAGSSIDLDEALVGRGAARRRGRPPRAACAGWSRPRSGGGGARR